MKNITRALLVSAALAGSASLALAQSASTVGSGGASGGSATIGSGGSAAAGGTSASTLGTGGTSTAPSGTSSTIGSAGSAATTEGKASSSTKLHDNPNMLQGMSKARAQDQGTWSKSMSKTKMKGDTLSSRTKSMSHEPGGPPAKSTTNERISTGQ